MNGKLRAPLALLSGKQPRYTPNSRTLRSQKSLAHGRRTRTLRETKGLLLALFKKADKILDDKAEQAARTEMNKMHQLLTESKENNHLTDPDLDGDDMKRDLREIRSDDVVRTEKSVIGSCEHLRISLYGGKLLYRQKFLSFSRGIIFNATDYRSRSINPRDLPRRGLHMWQSSTLAPRNEVLP